MKIGIATCAEKPELTVGDQRFAAELCSLGMEAVPLIWTDPNSLEKAWDVIVVRSVWDYHHRHQEFRDWVVRAHGSSGKLLNSLETILWNIDKLYLSGLERRGIPCVPSLFIPQCAEVGGALENVRSKGWDQIVIKPTISATAYLTSKMSVRSEGVGKAIQSVQAQADVLVQPYLSSVEAEGEASLIFTNAHAPELSHAVLKLPRTGDFRVQSDFGGTEKFFNPTSELVDFSLRALREVPGEWVFARVDLIDWQTRPLVSELELIEPNLFFHLYEPGSGKLAQALRNKLDK
jgi:hypothetical protein